MLAGAPYHRDMSIFHLAAQMRLCRLEGLVGLRVGVVDALDIGVNETLLVGIGHGEVVGHSSRKSD